MAARKVQPVNVDDHVYTQIRRAVVEGRYAPGGRLVEQRLAEEYEVSRTPVREALHRLEAEGLVEFERNRGSHVRDFSADDIADLYEVRARLEAYSAELAAKRSTPEQLEQLHRAAGDFDAAVADAGGQSAQLEVVRRLDAANARFHATLLGASKHVRIHQLVGRATDVPLVFRALRHFGPAELSRSALFHHLIVDAVAAGEPDRAGRLMTEHVLQGRDTLLAHLELVASGRTAS